MKLIIVLLTCMLVSLLLFSCKEACESDFLFENKMHKCINIYEVEDLTNSEVTQAIRYLKELTGQMPDVYEDWEVGEISWTSETSYQNDVSKYTKWFNENKCKYTLTVADSIVTSKIDSLNHLYVFGCDYMRNYIRDSLQIEIMDNELNEQSLRMLYEWGMLKKSDLFEVDSTLKSCISKIYYSSFSFVMPRDLFFLMLLRSNWKYFGKKYGYFAFLNSVIMIKNEDSILVVYEYLDASKLTKYKYCNFNNCTLKKNPFRRIENDWYGWSYVDVRVFDL